VPTTTPIVATRVAPDALVSEAIENAVVEVYATLRSLDSFKPWNKQAPGEISGSGGVIEGHRILTETDGILTDNGIRAQGSPDMLAIWNGTAAENQITR